MRASFTKAKDSLFNSSKILFIATSILICISQFLLLKIVLNFGLSSEDWLLVFDYKTIGGDRSFLDKLSTIFITEGIYSTTFIFYIGILESFLKDNFLAYQLTNITFKILATLSLFPLILIVFKRKLLAFLTTFLYGISYSSTGALQFVVKGTDYLAIFFMNICLIMYYFSFNTNRNLFLLFTSVLLFLAFIFSPIRIYPFLLFIFLFEVIFWFESKGFFGLIKVFFRLVIIFSPFILLLVLLPKSTGSYLNGPLVVYSLLSYGNYQLLLTPFSGLGYAILPNDYWSIFGKLTLDNFKDYMSFLISGPIIIYSALTILLGFLISKGKAAYWFILGVIATNIVFEIICYFLITNVRGGDGPNIKGFYHISTYAIFLGFYVVSVAISSLILWFKNKFNILLFALFIGPIFSSIFLWGTWIIIGDNLSFKEGIHWYLIIPPIGTSIFLASLMTLGFDRIKRIVNPNLRTTLITGLFLIIVPIYLISSKEINTTFTNLLNIGYGASDINGMKSKIFKYLINPADQKNALFYFDASDDLTTPQLFYPVTVMSGFEQKMHIYNGRIIDGCVGIITEKAILQKSITMKYGVKGFNSNSLCVEDSYATGMQQVFYSSDEFYSFKLKDKNVIDVKENVLKELGFDN
ncbi:hypothetical protein HYW42_02860 [Candidatus Daviesbacteria bacterium]|nr:hypothetical protein [Candidatus Daviesbacteria bacterium]